MENEDVKKPFENLQLQEMGDEEVKKCLVGWLQDTKEMTPGITSSFYYDKGPFMQFIHYKKRDGVDCLNANTPMQNNKFNLPGTIRVQLIAAYTEFADVHKLRMRTDPNGSYTLSDFENLGILVKFIRVFTNILGTKYGEMKFQWWKGIVVESIKR